MSRQRLDEALQRFTAAVKHVLETEPKEQVIEHFLQSSPTELQQILKVCEQIEEYEICAVLFKALKEQEATAV